ncbi:DivIVA domain-containing protein [Lunatibacter salilacus]|uniref:DivIVA domain-containing protein n=1 Tax=Lunatibacter salilacus TaxID=2483804 RepID=UPI00131ABAC0|nr:DivIVA domain-containing protein [Lunatibacter salilacus]
MKITPLDIRQKTFEKQIRGYDKDEVSSFLIYLSQEWEKVMEEKNMLQMKYEQADKESRKLREIEDSLFKTLKTAEDTGASIIEHANKTADLILKEAQMNADLMESDSKGKARNLLEQAENQSREIIEDLKDEVRSLVDSYSFLVNQRESILKNIKNLANDTLENVRQNQDEFQKIDLSIHTQRVKELQRRGNYQGTPSLPSAEQPSSSLSKEAESFPEINEESGIEEKPEPPYSREPEATNPIEKEETSNKPNERNTGSFFDQFD